MAVHEKSSCEGVLNQVVHRFKDPSQVPSECLPLTPLIPYVICQRGPMWEPRWACQFTRQLMPKLLVIKSVEWICERISYLTQDPVGPRRYSVNKLSNIINAQTSYDELSPETQSQDTLFRDAVLQVADSLED